jgi:YD repeat-containing protein
VKDRASARTSDGHLIRYDYEDRSQAGRKVKDTMTSGTNQWALKSVVYPPKMRGHADFPRTQYQYLDNTHRPFLITTVTNRPEKGPWRTTTTSWTYDVKKRVTSAERSPSGERWQYAYDDAKSQVTVTDPAGWRVLYDRRIGSDGITVLDPVGGAETASGKPSGLPPKASTQAIVVPPFIIPNCWLGILCPRLPPICMGDVDDQERDCDNLSKRDEQMCRMATLPNTGARARCWESVAERYGACRAGRPIPELVTW